MSIPLAEDTMTWILTALAVVAVWVPFYRGVVVSLRARIATRRIEAPDLRRALLDNEDGEHPDSLAILMARTLRKSLPDTRSGGEAREGALPDEFVLDATRQYVANEYDTHYAKLISMYGNLLPPIGFIGTTGGMFILFLAMHMSNSALEMGALAVALTSSIVALVGFSVLEGLKIGLYGRLWVCMADVQSFSIAEPEARR